MKSFHVVFILISLNALCFAQSEHADSYPIACERTLFNVNLDGVVEKSQETRWLNGKDIPEAMGPQGTSPMRKVSGSEVSPRLTCESSVSPIQNYLSSRIVRDVHLSTYENEQSVREGRAVSEGVTLYLSSASPAQSLSVKGGDAQLVAHRVIHNCTEIVQSNPVRNPDPTRPANIEGYRRVTVRLNDEVTEPVPYSNSLFTNPHLQGFLFDNPSRERAHNLIVP